MWALAQALSPGEPPAAPRPRATSRRPQPRQAPAGPSDLAGRPEPCPLAPAPSDGLISAAPGRSGARGAAFGKGLPVSTPRVPRGSAAPQCSGD